MTLFLFIYGVAMAAIGYFFGRMGKGLDKMSDDGSGPAPF